MFIDANGKTWYKGNLHTHTTVTDGKKTPEEVIALYRENGYDFLSLTDHWKHSETRMTDDGMLLLRGCEYNINGADILAGVFHIVAIGEREPAKLDRELANGTYTAQDIVDAIHAVGGSAILAHPAWSLNHPDEALCLKGFSAVEIYNSVSDANQSSRPYSGYFVDLIANKGMFLNIAATDDVHYYNGSDETKSYIMVKADSLDDVFEAIKNGDYYATQGPEVHVRREGDKLICDCSECVKIDFLSNAAWGPDRITRGKDLTHAQYQIKPFDKWVRVEVLDENGNYAWSNIIKI